MQLRRQVRWQHRMHLPLVSVAVAVLVVSFHGTGAQVPFSIPCPKLQVVQNFDTQRYLGLWYEIEKYPAVFQKSGTCTTATYSNLPDGAIRVFNQAFNTSSQTWNTALGTAELADPKLGAKLKVSFPNSPFQRPVPPDGNYWVLETDYTNYSIVWSCESFSGRNFQFLWYLSRDQFPHEEGVAFVHKRIDSFGLDRSFLVKTEQANCPKAPDSAPTSAKINKSPIGPQPPRVY